jgi:hypothetical protein
MLYNFKELVVVTDRLHLKPLLGSATENGNFASAEEYFYSKSNVLTAFSKSSGVLTLKNKFSAFGKPAISENSI